MFAHTMINQGASDEMDDHNGNKVKEFESNLGKELFSQYMQLLVADDVFKPMVPCFSCGKPRSPKD